MLENWCDSSYCSVECSILVVMQPAIPDLVPPTSPSSPTTEKRESLTPEVTQIPVARRNFVVMAAYQIVMRTGWIFKTETVIMPAVLDQISGIGWVRGLLPLLSRLGHGLVPFMMASHVEQAPYKKKILGTSTWLMFLCFILWFAMFTPLFVMDVTWKTIVFLSIYAVFFMCVGVNVLTLNTLQGKLIATTSRGRLMCVSGIVGAISAISCVLCLMPGWLQADNPRFDLIFLFPGILIALAAALAWCFDEKPDVQPKVRRKKKNGFVEVYEALRDDQNFRRLAYVALAVGCSILLFPHYQNLGLQGMRLELSQLMWWVVVQNVGTGIFSIPMGTIADRGGNRLVLQIFLLGLVAAPLLAVLLFYFEISQWYVFVFLLVGLTPVVIRTLQNFTLEICCKEDHPRYLSTLNLCLAAPMCFSPLVGACVDLFAPAVVFGCVAACVLAGWCVTFTLIEPRNSPHRIDRNRELLP